MDTAKTEADSPSAETSAEKDGRDGDEKESEGSSEADNNEGTVDTPTEGETQLTKRQLRKLRKKENALKHRPEKRCELFLFALYFYGCVVKVMVTHGIPRVFHCD